MLLFNSMSELYGTRSSAVAVIADRIN